MTAGVIGPEAVATMTYEAVAERLALVREVAGPRIEDIELNIRAFIVRITDDRTSAVSQIASFVEVEDEMIAASPFALIGTVDEVTEALVRRREQLGFSYVIVGGDDIEPFAPVVARLSGT
jgi:hypothetical protein